MDMIVEMLRCSAGPDGVKDVGTRHRVSKAEADVLVKAGAANVLPAAAAKAFAQEEAESEVETADAAPEMETSVGRKPAKRKSNLI